MPEKPNVAFVFVSGFVDGGIFGPNVSVHQHCFVNKKNTCLVDVFYDVSHCVPSCAYIRTILVGNRQRFACDSSLRIEIACIIDDTVLLQPLRFARMSYNHSMILCSTYTAFFFFLGSVSPKNKMR